MSAIRVPLLCAFAGGCLSSAVLFGVWRAEAGAEASAATKQRSLIVESGSAAASAAPLVQPRRELVAGVAGERVPTPAEQPTSQPSQVVDSGAPSTAGSAVSDVLMGLEAAYRARVAAAAPAPATPPEERAVAAVPSDNALAPTGSPPEAPTQPVAALAPVVPPAGVAPVVTPAALPAAVAPAALPAAVASVEPSSTAPQMPAAPAFVAQEDWRPSEVHIGDVNQNTYVSNVRQGDVYVIQQQPLVMLQYLQLLGMPSGLAAPARHGRGAGAQGVAFSSTLTNPDNPWGFHFRPPHLVH